MTTDDRDRQLIGAARADFERQVEGLDARTARRLQTARRRALEASPSRGWMPWLAAGGVAAAAGLAGVLWFAQPVTHPPVSDPEEFELVTAGESLEFYDELEFYHWLADRNSTS